MSKAIAFLFILIVGFLILLVQEPWFWISLGLMACATVLGDLQRRRKD